MSSTYVLILLSICICFSSNFSDHRLSLDLITCSILHDKCEWNADWSNARGIRRELDIGNPRVQFFYFCSESYCNQWVDENKQEIPGAGNLDHLEDDIFIIETLGINTTGVYFKIPEDSNLMSKFIIE